MLSVENVYLGVADMYPDILYMMKGYVSVRSNEKGDVWYTSEMLYKYRFYKNEEKLVTSAKVIEIYDYYAILDYKLDAKIEPMMIVKIKN